MHVLQKNELDYLMSEQIREARQRENEKLFL